MGWKAVHWWSPWRIFQTCFSQRYPVPSQRGSASPEQGQEHTSAQFCLNSSPSTLRVLGSKKPSETKDILLQPLLDVPKYTCSATPAGGGNLCPCQTTAMGSSIDWETWIRSARRDHTRRHWSTATDWEGEYCCLHFTQSGLRYRNMGGVLSLIKDWWLYTEIAADLKILGSTDYIVPKEYRNIKKSHTRSVL